MSDKDLLLRFDELQRQFAVTIEPIMPEADLQKLLYLAASDVQEVERLEEQINRGYIRLKEQEKMLGVKDHSLKEARKLLNQEKNKRIKAEYDLNEMKRTMQVIQKHLENKNLTAENKEAEETIKKLPYLTDKQKKRNQLTTISETSTASLSISMDNLSDSDLDDLDISRTRSGKCYHYSRDPDVSTTRKHYSSGVSRKSHSLQAVSDTGVVATTKVVLPTHGTILAKTSLTAQDKQPLRQTLSQPVQPTTTQSSSSESDEKGKDKQNINLQSLTRKFSHPEYSSVPITPGGLYPDLRAAVPARQEHLPKFNSVLQLQNREHKFTAKTSLKTETCGPCEKRIGFNKNVLKCQDCRSVCHESCKDQVPLPCVPVGATPTHKLKHGSIADFAPDAALMIPSLIVHSLQEIEKRGLDVELIYRKSALEREVKELREKFLRGKGVPVLSKYSIHTICDNVKKFLRALDEPLIPNSSWKRFVDSCQIDNEEYRMSELYRAIKDIAKPNKDTLAFLLLHLIKVSESPACCMSVSSLAKIFGPTVLGYSSNMIGYAEMQDEATVQQKVLETLMLLGTDFWNDILNVIDNPLANYWKEVKGVGMFSSPKL